MFYLDDYNLAKFKNQTRQNRVEKAQARLQQDDPSDIKTYDPVIPTGFKAQQTALGVGTLGAGAYTVKHSRKANQFKAGRKTLAKKMKAGGLTDEAKKSTAQTLKRLVKTDLNPALASKRFGKRAAALGAAGLAANYIRKKFFTAPE